jgi:hypothetical protein
MATNDTRAGDPDRGHARELLVDELKEAVGEEAVERADLDVDRAIERRPEGLGGAVSSNRLLLIVIGGALLTAGVVVSLATENWVFFAAAIVVHALVSVVVIGTALAASTQVEKPAPTTVTALEDKGVPDPEAAVNDLVEQANEQREGSRFDRAATQADDTVAPEDDAAAAARGQQSASTPASEPTRPTSREERSGEATEG